MVNQEKFSCVDLQLLLLLLTLWFLSLGDPLDGLTEMLLLEDLLNDPLESILDNLFFTYFKKCPRLHSNPSFLSQLYL